MVAGSAADPLPADAERSSAPPKTDAPTSAFASGAVAEVAALASKLLDADEGSAASAMADVLERIKELASENEILRASLAEEHETHLNALEANRELNWRVRTGSSAGADATTVTREWEASDAKMALLMGENNELEARWRQTAEELEKERAGTAQLMASHTEALAAALLSELESHATSRRLWGPRKTWTVFGGPRIVAVAPSARRRNLTSIHHRHPPRR